MAVGAAVVAVAGLAVTLYGNHKASEAQEEAMNAKAAAKRKQADDLMERFEQNVLALEVSGKQFGEGQSAQFAKGGVEIGEGSPLLAIENTFSSVQRQIGIERKEAEDKAELLRSGADVDVTLGGDIRTAGQIQNVGTFLQGASTIYAKSGS